MRRPVVVFAGTAVVLVVLALPFARARFSGTDERVLPPGTESRVVAEQLKTRFPDGGADPVVVVLTGADQPAATAFAETVARLPHVRAADVAEHRGQAWLVSVSYPGASDAPATRRLVDRIRGLPPPSGARVLVGGTSADLVDLLDSLRAHLPWMALTTTAAMMVVLFLAFGSMLLPLKAVLMNAVSIGASFGAVVWIFQDGHLADLLRFTPTGSLEATQPILMLAILFGLSTDYEVFLLSRVREEWDRTGDNVAAVATGLARTGGIITSAALLLIVVVAGFAAGGISFIKMIGVGMIVAILVDATIVRALLVPAAMRLMGRANWWAPGPLARLYHRYGIQDSGRVPPIPVPRRRAVGRVPMVTAAGRWRRPVPDPALPPRRRAPGRSRRAAACG
jgi:RND superfamily putative drug exporter